MKMFLINYYNEYKLQNQIDFYNTKFSILFVGLGFVNLILFLVLINNKDCINVLNKKIEYLSSAVKTANKNTKDLMYDYKILSNKFDEYKNRFDEYKDSISQQLKTNKNIIDNTIDKTNYLEHLIKK